MQSIPGVLDVTAGPSLASDRAVVDDTFDVGIVMTFRDAEALRSYLAHPQHVQQARDVLRPLCDRVIVYDIAH